MTGEGTPVQCKRAQEGDKNEDPLKKVRREQDLGKALGMEF